MKHWKQFEFTVAALTEGDRSHCSGATEGNSDVTNMAFGIECKAPQEDTGRFVFTIDIWNKIVREAKKRALIPGVAVCLDNFILFGVEYEVFKLYGAIFLMHCHVFRAEVTHKSYPLVADKWRLYSKIAVEDGRIPILLLHFKKQELSLAFMDTVQFKIINSIAIEDEKGG